MAYIERVVRTVEGDQDWIDIAFSDVDSAAPVPGGRVPSLATKNTVRVRLDRSQARDLSSRLAELVVGVDRDNDMSGA